MKKQITRIYPSTYASLWRKFWNRPYVFKTIDLTYVAKRQRSVSTYLPYLIGRQPEVFKTYYFQILPSYKRVIFTRYEIVLK